MTPQLQDFTLSSYFFPESIDIKEMLRGKKVGLLGGSFNPAHIGHLEISKYALDQLRLDNVIWFVAPQNPFKPPYPTSLLERARYALELSNHPRILVSTLEGAIKSPYTYETLLYLRKTFPSTEFTWLMGSDCLKRFHEWEYYQSFLELVNLAIFRRKGYVEDIASSPAGQMLTKESLKKGQFRVLFCENKLIDISSTEIRAGKIYDAGR